MAGRGAILSSHYAALGTYNAALPLALFPTFIREKAQPSEDNAQARHDLLRRLVEGIFAQVQLMEEDGVVFDWVSCLFPALM